MLAAPASNPELRQADHQMPLSYAPATEVCSPSCRVAEAARAWEARQLASARGRNALSHEQRRVGRQSHLERFRLKSFFPICLIAVFAAMPI